MRLYLYSVLLFSFLLNFSFNLSAQNNKFSNLVIESNYHYGYLLPEYTFFNYLTNDAVKAFDIELKKELKGEKLWERVYHYPSVGLATYCGSLGNDTVFGKVISVYPFLNFPLIERGKILFSIQIGIGGAYSTEEFNIENNYYNIAIASHLNIWVQAKSGITYKINDKYSVSAGTAFGHFSNANFSEPNLGLNFWTFYGGASIAVSEETKRNSEPIPLFKRKNEYAFIAAGGGKHTRRFAEQAYFAGSISGEYKRITGYKFAFGGGIDFFYDASIPDEMLRAGISEVKNIYKLKSGMHLSQELIIGKFSIIIQEGMYIGFKDYLYKHLMYNRGIVRYKFSKHFFADIAMKTNLNILDVAEVGIGYYTHRK